MRRILVASVAMAVFASLPVRSCQAHPFDVVIVNLSLEVSGHADIQGTGTVLLDSRTSPQQFSNRVDEHPDLVVSDIIGQLSLGPSTANCSIIVDLSGASSTARQRPFSAFCPGGASGDEIRIKRDPQRLFGAPSNFTTIYFISVKGDRYTITLDRDDSERRVRLVDGWATLEMLRMGVRHIGAAPEEWLSDSNLSLPEGIDHILFVLTLVLASSSLLTLVKTATGFTLGHSISLAVVTLCRTSISPVIIEPAIAASIAIMALDATRASPWKRAWIPASVFGLLHGCGFASALLEQELQGSSLAFGLLGFNVGVEIGQLVFVIFFWLLLSLAAKLAGSRRSVTLVTAVGVLLVACWWFIERVMLAL